MNTSNILNEQAAAKNELNLLEQQLNQQVRGIQRKKKTTKNILLTERKSSNEN